MAELRAELTELDSELAEATFQLQRQRAAFAEQVSKNDSQRSQKAEEVKLALQQLEAERMRMDCFHQELEAESQIARDLQATCRNLEQQLDLCDAGTSSAQQPEDDLAAHEALLESAHGRLETAEAEHKALAEAEEEAAAAQRSTCPKAARLLLKAAMEDLAEEAEHMAKAVARRTERRLEAATCRLAAASASTRVVTVALARHAAARRAQEESVVRAAQPSSSWDAELAGLLDALTEAEAVSRRQLELQQASAGRRSHTPGSAEVATLRHAVGRELKSGVFQGFAATLGSIPIPEP